jgi:hypothetical protein
LYGGRIQIITNKDAFIYSIYRKKEILNLLDLYFSFFPLKSSKAKRLNLIKEYYLLRDYSKLNVNEIDKLNQ